MIIVAGSLSFDYIFNFSGLFKDNIIVDKIHVLDVSFLTNKMRRSFGGTAGIISYNLALLGLRPAILATAGKDFIDFQRFLQKAGVETSYIKIYKSDFTSNYFALVDKNDNQLGAFYSGAMEKSRTLSLKQIKEKMDFMIISPTDPQAMINFALECKKMKIPYMFDLGRQIPLFTKSQILKGLAGSQILIGNDYELSMLKKKTGLSEEQIRSKTQILITTLGPQGSVIESIDKKIKVKAARVKKDVDPVGAGDAYRAGFITGYLKGLDLKTCGQMGSVTAAYTVEQYGSTTHKFTKKEFCDRYKRNFSKSLNF